VRSTFKFGVFAVRVRRLSYLSRSVPEIVFFSVLTFCRQSCVGAFELRGFGNCVSFPTSAVSQFFFLVSVKVNSGRLSFFESAAGG